MSVKFTLGDSVSPSPKMSFVRGTMPVRPFKFKAGNVFKRR
jgi:hypothetical protein